MKIVQISDTHGLHHNLKDIPAGDVLVHCGDFSHEGTEDEVLDFLNWFIELPHPHKIFVVGNHDLCLWDADGIEDLPDDVHFLQDKSINIDGKVFFGLGYNHTPELIPYGCDVVITHEPPLGIMDESNCISWGNLEILNRIYEVKPRFHLFGHAHEGNGIIANDGISFSNGSLLDDKGSFRYRPRILSL